MQYNPSYGEYARILDTVLETGLLMDFFEARCEREFIVLRHDIEFSVEKAFSMANIEKTYGVKSTYFVQIGSAAYNAFDDDNLDMLNEMADMGHTIGLHYRQGEDCREDSVRISQQLEVLRAMVPKAKRIFSCHRPRRGTPYELYTGGDALNAYSQPFFYKTSTPERAWTRYITDSKWRWNNGEPDRETLLSLPKIQLLTHPFQWSARGDSMEKCFNNLERRASADLKCTFREEYERYAEIER